MGKTAVNIGAGMAALLACSRMRVPIAGHGGARGMGMEVEEALGWVRGNAQVQGRHVLNGVPFRRFTFKEDGVVAASSRDGGLV